MSCGRQAAGIYLSDIQLAYVEHPNQEQCPLVKEKAVNDCQAHTYTEAQEVPSFIHHVSDQSPANIATMVTSLI